MTDDTPTEGSTTPDHPPADELAAQLQCSSVELATTDPTAGHADLDPVGDILTNARIVGLGEATHGTREVFRLKHRLVRYLVEEHGLRLFAMEANLPEAMALDEYIVHGEGNPCEALAGTHFWIWRTEAVLALVEWFREFNTGRPLDDRVRFYGIDAQYTTGAIDYLDEFLADTDPSLREELQTDLAAADDEGNTDDQYMSNHDSGAAERLLDRLGTVFEERREAFAAATSERETVIAGRCLRVVEQVRQRRIARATDGIQASMIVRDEAMAENLSWILNREATDTAVLWAHDAHVCRTANFSATVDRAPSLGSHLADRYGDEYFALGFDFLRGSFRAIGVGLSPESELDTWSLDAPPRNSITRVFSATDHDLAFFDFATDRADDQLETWLTQPRAKRELGAVYYGSDGPSENEKDGQAAHNAVRILPEAFDGLLFIRETMPSVVLDNPEH